MSIQCKQTVNHMLFLEKNKEKNLSTQGVKPMLQTKHVFALEGE